ncbi:hypothetical protein ACWGLE_00820 [Streptomyces sp. NPDC055897]
MITIDGLHRILGVHLEKKRVTDEVSRIDREIHRANEAKKAKLEQDRETLIDRMQRLKDEFVGIDMYVERDGVKGQQMFVDVADNAKGISGAVHARFDTSRIANRTLSDIVTPLSGQGRHQAGPNDPDQPQPDGRKACRRHHAGRHRRSRWPRQQEGRVADRQRAHRERPQLPDVISIAFTALAEITEEDVDNYAPRSPRRRRTSRRHPLPRP